jgi:hypothetical protein
MLQYDAARLTARGRGWQKLRPDKMGLCTRPHARVVGLTRRGASGTARTIITLQRHLMP